jgi:serine/threonine protein kinase/WD40 repeat protein
MSNSPKDNRPEDRGANHPSKAGDGPKAGDEQETPPQADGTLDAFRESDAEPSTPPLPEEDLQDLAGTLDSDVLGLSPASVGAVDSGTAMLPEEPDVEEADEEDSQLRTIPLPGEGAQAVPPILEGMDSRTIIFDESGILPSAGSVAQEPTGSSEKLRRVWNAAVGSSGKDSGQSLSYERPEASDSVLGRVAIRSVTDANAAQAADADYQIQDKLGVGGMGVVFSAIQTAVNRKVALKTLKADKSKDSSARKQFFYEAEITADLDHPNIPPIYEFGATVDDVCFYTMKLIRGAEWDRILPKKTQEENLEIFNNVADAIAFAHSKNILHRDIKPDNVIVGAFGEVYVTDWGLAVNLNRTPDKSQIRFGGTPEYMAPEMGLAKGELIDKACDIYLLGAVLFQIITTKRPRSFKVKASVGERVKAVISNQIVETTVEDPLLEVALKAMSTRPEDRYKTVEDLQGAVREIQRKNTNIKSSIDLTKRSQDEARLAMAGKDYDRFNRAIFGFRDAMELWDGNKDAEGELKKVRLAYGQCAFDRGDFDLAIQTLDRKVPEESMLLGKAEKAKQAVLQREQRFKTLRNVFTGVTAAFLLLTTGLASYAYIVAKSEADALTKAQLALEGEKQALEEKNELAEENLKVEAKRAKAEEEKLLTEIQAQKDKEKAALELAEAEKKRQTEENNRIAAEAKAAKDREMAAVERERIEREAKIAAQIAAAKIQLGQQLTKLGFANAQVDQFNPIGAANLLDQMKAVDMSETLQERTPKLLNWAMNRVALLSNLDLPKKELEGTVTALDFATGKNLGVAGMEDGTVRLLRLEGGRLMEQSQKHVGSGIAAAAISPAGDEALLAIRVAGEEAKPQYQLFRWGLEGDLEPMRIEATGNRYFQGFGYNSDGTAVVAGIRGGVWARIRGGDWKVLAERVKGELLDLTWTDNESLLVLSSLEGIHHLYVIRGALGDQPTSGLVAMASPIEGQITAIGMAGPRVLVGTDRGNLTMLDLNVSQDANGRIDARLENGFDLPKRHRRPITQIDSDAAGRIVTGSREPTAHVWRVAPNGGLEYETFLSGAPGPTSDENNIQRVVFVDPSQVVHVDSKGVALAVDIDRQKQRRRLTRISEQTTEPELYQQAVVGIHPRGKTSEAISVDANGVVDLWNLQSGRTRRLSGPQTLGERFSYFGHTPNAELADTVVDAEAGVVITSARLPRSSRGYLVDPKPNLEYREYCVWDQNTGAMLRRWTDASETGEEPRLSLVASGMLLIGSDTATKIVDFEGRDLPGLSALTQTAAVFAITNPRYPEITAVFKRAGGGGMGWIWNRTTGQWFRDGSNSVPFPRSAPIQAVWSQDGQRLYVLDVGGSVTQCTFSNDALTPIRQGSGSNEISLNLPANLQNAIRSFQDVDLSVVGGDGTDRLLVNVRDTKSQSLATGLSTLRFSADGLLDTPTTTIDPAGLSWLNDLDSIQVQPLARVLSKRRVGEKLFVSMRSGSVFGVNAASGASTFFGRQQLLASTSNAEGTLLLTLHQDGSILRLDLVDPNQAAWSRIPFAVPGASRIELSPNGLELAIYDSGKRTLRIVKVEDGTGLREYEAIAQFGWDPKQDASLALVHSTGRIAMEQAGEAKELSDLPIAGEKVLGLAFFEEKWQDPARAPTPYILVQSQSEVDQEGSSGKLWFIPREPGDAGWKTPWSKELPRDLTLATSPTDSILATGDRTGAIRIWFASPEFDILSPIYDLPSDGDSEILRIAFSGDGDTLMTSDDKQRLYGWMSRDALSVPGRE